MGWNPWNTFGGRFTEAIVKENADALVSKGLQKAGYVYVNLDGGGRLRGAEKVVADYVHGKGLKFGVYGNHDARYDIMGKEKERVAGWVSWGAEYLKYDAYVIPLSNPTWIAMRDALKSTGIVYSVHCADDFVDETAPGIGHVWRTGPDVLLVGEKPGFRDVLRNAYLNNRAADLAGPGYWNDPDMLMVGIPGGLTLDEERTHFGLWAIMAAPLLIGCDLRSIGDSSLNILLNKEAIAVDQDPLGYQGRIVKRWPGAAVTAWLKKMKDGGCALLAVNASGPARVTLRWSEFGRKGRMRVRDLWTHADLSAADSLCASIPAHGSVFLRLRSSAPASGAPAGQGSAR
jgi:alpha-galactosidase